MAKNRINGSSVLFVFLIGAFIGGFLVVKYRPLPEGKVLVNTSVIDSLNAFIEFADSIKNIDLTPDTITIVDTVIYEKEKEIITNPFSGISKNDTILYKDSLTVHKQVNVWVEFKVKGFIVDNEIEWRYQPVVHTLSTTIEKPVFVPVINTVTKEIPKYITGHYVSVAAGGNAKLFTFGVDYDLIKKDHIYGIQYRRYGDQNVYGFKVGINLRTLFRF